VLLRHPARELSPESLSKLNEHDPLSDPAHLTPGPGSEGVKESAGRKKGTGGPVTATDTCPGPR
jgi:hypothetical protein